MARKFKIAQEATFKAPVTIPRVGGDPIVVNMEYKYLTRKELADLYESWQEYAKGIDIKEGQSLGEITDLEVGLQVKQLSDILVGWEFEDEFNEENISQFVIACIGATPAVLDKYQEAYSKTQLGN